MKTVNNLIIGFGKAGKTLAVALAKAGQSVILVEKSAKMYGGTCINIGCIPSKKLSFLANQVTQTNITDLANLINLDEIQFSNKRKAFRKAVQSKNKLIGALNQANYNKVSDAVEVITGTAIFVDEHTVDVASDAGVQQIKADKIFINTGASNWQPAIEGLANNPYVYDSTSLMQLENLPEHLVIIGAGYIGLEFAFTFANFGSKVTILETSADFVPREDSDIANNLRDIMQQKGIELRLSQKIERVSVSNVTDANDTQIYTQDAVTGEAKVIHADAILVATGRRANTTGLSLEKAGVKVTERGTIEVNDKLQTSVPHIWAMGDVAGSPQFTYMSLDDYRVVKSQLLGNNSHTTKDREFAYAVFTSPPLANAGMTEAVAKQQGFDVLTVSMPASAIPKAKITEDTQGLLKAVVDANTDKILGVQLLCAEAHEMINFMQLAIKYGLTYQQVRDHIFMHPTMSESLNDLFALVDGLK